MLRFARSVRFKMIAGFALMIAPLVYVLVYNNYYSIDVVREQVSRNYSGLLEQVVTTNDTAMREFNYYLYRLERDPDIVVMQTSGAHTDDYVLAKQRVYNKFVMDIGYYQYINTFFVYSYTNDDLLLATQENEHYRNRIEQIREYIEQIERIGLGQTVSNSVAWDVVKTSAGPEPYMLMRTVKIGSDMYAGALIQPKSLVTPFSGWDFGEGGGAYLTSGQLPITDQSMAPEYYYAVRGQIQPLAEHAVQRIRHPEDGYDYMLVGADSKVTPISYILLINENSMLKNLPYLQLAIFWIPVGILLVLFLYLLFLQRIFFRPMGRLISAMRRLGRGQLDTRLKETNSTEFGLVSATFNSMAGQIENLKIHVYEEKLRVQKAEFNHLQSQINPHFYMNCLNLIYNLASLKDFRTVQKLALHLADYFRFIMRVDREAITLAEEMKHISDYLHIQTMRYPELLQFSIRIEPYENCLLPPLIVQPFVENAIVHGFSKSGEPFKVEIAAEADPEQPERFVRIFVADNGAGFSDTLLAQFNSGEYLLRPRGEHLGIWNVMRRLNMIYGSTGEVRFANRSPGAVVTIRLPIRHESAGEETKEG